MKPKIVFMGTPEFAASILESLIKTEVYEICAVLTQADKPVGRGLKLSLSPVKVVAQKYGLAVWTPKSIKNISLDENSNGTKILKTTDTELNSLVNHLNTTQPVISIVVAYSKIIPESLLQWSPLGFVNVHTSLLPRWRGAAPIQHALFAGDKKTGVSIMQMDKGLDTGAVYQTAEVEITAEDDLGSLTDKLLRVATSVVLETVPLILEKKIIALPQLTEGITYANKWEKADLNINWTESAAVTLRRIRTCAPDLGAKTVFKGRNIKVYAAHLVQDSGFQWQAAGVITEVNKSELIICAGSDSVDSAKQFIAIDKLQFPGKAVRTIKEVLNGYKFQRGEKFN